MSSSLCSTGVFNKVSVQPRSCFAWAEEGKQPVFGSRALLSGALKEQCHDDGQ